VIKIFYFCCLFSDAARNLKLCKICYVNMFLFLFTYGNVNFKVFSMLGQILLSAS
jgi:hypothetical protein